MLWGVLYVCDVSILIFYRGVVLVILLCVMYEIGQQCILSIIIIYWLQ